jgi:hypothetical protein
VDDPEAMVTTCDARKPEELWTEVWGALEWAALAFLLGAATMATVLAH